MNQGDLFFHHPKACFPGRFAGARPALTWLLCVNLAALATPAVAAFKPAAPLPASRPPSAPAVSAKPPQKATPQPVATHKKIATPEAVPLQRSDARCVDLTTKLSLGVSELTDNEQQYFNDQCRLRH